MTKIPAEKLRRRISQFTNSQNPISDRDMGSDHDQQINIQEHIRLVYDGFFWERKSGERRLPTHLGNAAWKRKHQPQPLRIINNLLYECKLKLDQLLH